MKPTYETTPINQRKMQKIAFNLTFNHLKIIYHRELIVHLQIDYTTILGPQIFLSIIYSPRNRAATVLTSISHMMVKEIG